MYEVKDYMDEEAIHLLKQDIKEKEENEAKERLDKENQILREIEKKRIHELEGMKNEENIILEFLKIEKEIMNRESYYLQKEFLYTQAFNKLENTIAITEEEKMLCEENLTKTFIKKENKKKND